MFSRLFMVLLVLFSAEVWALPVAWDETDDRWLSRHSEHFDIHYRQGYEDMAQHALDIAEQVHTELVPFFGQAPETPTQLVLTDEVDYSNGWATPVPFAQIRLFASPPEDVAGLEHMDEWLHGLIRHEYVHTLHMELQRGATEGLRSIFGRIAWFFPHVFIPSTFSEGLAVYLETDHDKGYGRLDSSYYAMQMRMEVLAGSDTLDKAVIPLRDWPTGKAYLYGAYFIGYLAETYGDDTVALYLTRYSGEPIPYFFQNSKARRVFGKDFEQLWADYQQWLNRHFADDIKQLSVNTQEGEALPFSAGYQRVTATSADALWLVSNNSEDISELTRLDLSSTDAEAKSMEMIRGATDMDIRDDGMVAISRILPYASGRAINDVFIWSDDHGLQRLTEQMRLRKVRWSADGQSLFASRKDKGNSEIWQLTLDGQATLLWQSQPQQVLGDFDVCADGLTLVASMKMPGQGWNLARYDLHENDWQLLTDTRATENSPECQADGSILYSADYDGVYNLYSLTPDSGDVQQWTRMLSGAFAPHSFGQGLIFQAYTAEGFQLSVLRKPQARQMEALAHFNIADKQARYDYPVVVVNPVTTTETEYSPWSTLRPHYWLPLWETSNHSSKIGMNTGGSDALGRHTYDLTLSWDTRQEWADFTATYLYDNRWQAFWSRSHEIHDLNLTTPDDWYVVQEDTVSLQRRYLMTAFEDRLQWHLGLTAEHNSIARRQSWMPSIQGLEETLAGTAFSYDSRMSLRNVHGVAWGTYADLVYESNDVLNSDYEGGILQGQWHRAFDLPGRHTVSLGVMGGVADEGAEAFTLGGLDSEETMLFGRDQFGLPGYESATQFGHKYYIGEVSYTAWLDRVEENYGLIPLGFGDISARLWYREGSAWFRNQHNDSLAAVGAELNIDVVLGYRLVLPLSLGYAKGQHDTLGDKQVYVRLQSVF